MATKGKSAWLKLKLSREEQRMRGKQEVLELYIKNQSRLCAYAHSFIKDYDTCKDIVQDVFLNFYENDFNHIVKAINKDGYLFSCVRNRCLDYLKGQSVRDRYMEKIVKELSRVEEDAVSEYEVKELSGLLEKAVNSLCNPTYTIFYKSRIEGKKNSEIAEEMGISIKTVEAHITKAVKQIKLVIKNLAIILLLATCLGRIML